MHSPKLIKNPSSLLQKQAEQSLNFFSNQQLTPDDWISKSILPRIKNNKLPILVKKKQQNSSRKYNQQVGKPFRVGRKRSDLYDEKVQQVRMNEVLTVVKSKKSLPSCPFKLNENFDKQHSSNIKGAKTQSDRKTPHETKIFKKVSSRLKRSQTEPSQRKMMKIIKTFENSGIPEVSRKKSENNLKTSPSESGHHRSPKKRKELQDIKALIEDKRNKCRKLAQGYLIFKKQRDYSNNQVDPFLLNVKPYQSAAQRHSDHCNKYY